MLLPLLLAATLHPAEDTPAQEALVGPSPIRAALTLEATRLGGLMGDRLGLGHVDLPGVRLVDRSELTGPRSAAFGLPHDADVARLLGLVGPDEDLTELLAGAGPHWVDAAFDAEDGTLLVADDLDLNEARGALARALSSYLADDGDADFASTTDERLAREAVERARAALALAATDPRGDRSGSSLRALVDPRLGVDGDAPPIVWVTRLALPLQGHAFLARAERFGAIDQRPSTGDLRRAAVDPPRSTEELLHPHRYWRRGDRERGEDRVTIEADVEQLPAGWSVLHSDVLGELVLGLVATAPSRRAGTSGSAMSLAQTRFARPDADGWDGDQVLLLGDDDSRALLLRSRFETESDAIEFEEALAVAAVERPGPPIETSRHGMQVEAFASDVESDALRAQLRRALGFVGRP